MPKHNQADFIDQYDDVASHGKIYCPHCKKESRDYHDSCIECGKDVGHQCGDYDNKNPAADWVSHDSGSFSKAFDIAWAAISKKSWDEMTEEEDSGWTDDAYQCRGCGKKMTPDEWEQKRCECGSKNTVHPSMR